MLGRYNCLSGDVPMIGRRMADLGDWWDDWKNEAVYMYSQYGAGTTADRLVTAKVRPYMLSKFQAEYANALDRVNRYIEQAGGVPDPVVSENLRNDGIRLKTKLEGFDYLARDIVAGGDGAFQVSDQQLRLDIGDFHAVRDSITNFYNSNAPIFQAVAKINVDAQAAADKVRQSMTPEVIEELESRAGGWFRNDNYFALVKNQYFMTELLKQYDRQLSTDTLNSITVQVAQNQKLIDESKPIIAKAGTAAAAAVDTVVDAARGALNVGKGILKWGTIGVMTAGILGTVGTVSIIALIWRKIAATRKTRRR